MAKGLDVPDVEPFITKGLLPENLPPIFSSRGIWKPLANLGSGYSINHQSTGEYATYSASKRGGQRRLFSIPHPAFVRDQAVFFQKHWSALVDIMDSSAGSVSKPEFSNTGPRYVRITSHGELPRLRLKAFSRFKFCAVTDVARFFPSVYTHTLPWAINGKKLAKTDTKSNSAIVFGNRLDFIIRQAQSRQTVGIPIGPDVSKIVAELLMASVDKTFVKMSGTTKPTFMRHVDDYWFGGNTREECEKHLQNVRSALRAHELDINETKTKIVSTKYIFGDTWPYGLEKELKDSLQVVDGGKAHDTVAVLSKIVDRATEDNDEGIIRHIIRKIDEYELWSRDWEMLEHFLAQCAVQFVHSFDYVVRIIAWRIRTDQQIDKQLWVEVANLVCQENAAVGRDSEVAWAIWLLKELGSKLHVDQVDLIMDNCGALVLSFLPHCLVGKMIDDRKLKEKLWTRIDGDPYSGASWPLTLEMTHLSLADPAWKNWKSTDTLNSIHKAKCTMVSWKAPPKVFEPDPSVENEKTEKPRHAIEDFGSDYSEFDDENEETSEFDVNEFLASL